MWRGDTEKSCIMGKGGVRTGKKRNETPAKVRKQKQKNKKKKNPKKTKGQRGGKVPPEKKKKTPFTRKKRESQRIKLEMNRVTEVERSLR